MTSKEADAAAAPATPENRDASGQAPEAWKIEATNDHGSRTYVVTDAGGRQWYAHEEQLPGWVVRALGAAWLADFAALADGYYTWSRAGMSKDEAILDEFGRANEQAWQSAVLASPTDADTRRGLRDAWKIPLEQRAALVADTVTYAVRLLDSLQREIAARSAVIQALAGEVETSRAQAEQAAQLAKLTEAQTQAVNAFLDRLLAARLGALESHARRREWMLATVVALAVGIASILVSHFLVGF